MDFDEWWAYLTEPLYPDGPGEPLSGLAEFAADVYAERGAVDAEAFQVLVLHREAELARGAAVLMTADLERTTGRAPALDVREQEWDGSMRVDLYYDGDACSTDGGFAAVRDPEVTVEACACWQDGAVEALWTAWPECPTHRVGCYARVVDRHAVWYCRYGKHVVARIGELDKPHG